MTVLELLTTNTIIIYRIADPVNSNDEVAVSEAYKNGGIRPALLKEKKSYVKYIIIGFIVLGILALFIYANVYEPRKRKNRRNPRSRRR